jgi:hypothetical protein
VSWPSVGQTLTYGAVTGYTTGTPSTSEAEYAIVGGSNVASGTGVLTAGGFYTIAVTGECSAPAGSAGLGPAVVQIQDNYPTSIPSGDAAIRVVNLAPSTNTLYQQYDLYSGATAITGLTDVAYGSVSNGGTYVDVAAGTSLNLKLYSHAAGATTSELVSSTVMSYSSAAKLNVFTPAAGGVYTIWIYGSPDSNNGTLFAGFQQDVE